MRYVLATALLLLFALPAPAQPVADTLFTWRGYAAEAQTRVQLFDLPEDENRPRTVVLTELAESPGPATVHDAQHLAELIGRHYGFDPAAAYWIFHWGAFSYAGAEPNARKELFLRATYRRTQTGRLSSPQWRVIRRDEVMDLTDRRFQD